MPDNFTPTPTYHRRFTFPTDGDLRNAASIRAFTDDMAEVLAQHAHGLSPQYERNNIHSWVVGVDDALMYTPNGTLTVSLNPGVCYVEGKRVQHTAATLAQIDESGHTFTANRDTYVGINESGLLEFQEVTTSAPAPTPSAGYIHILKVVTGFSEVDSQEYLLPTIPIDTGTPRLYTAAETGGDADPSLAASAYRLSGAIAKLTTENTTWGPILVMPEDSVFSYRVSITGMDILDVSDNACRHMSGHIHRVGSGTPVNTIQLDDAQNGVNIGNFSLGMGAAGEINVVTEQGAISALVACEWTGQLLQLPPVGE